jgi:hypothetical protein
MSAAPAPRLAALAEPAAEELETRAGEPPAVIRLPDERQQGRKKVTSGSDNRKRRHVERFRTDDTEHSALHERLQASGKSLAAYVMQLTGIEGGKDSRPRLHRRGMRADMPAFLQGMVEIRRVNSLLNQQTRAINTAMLFIDEHGAARLEAEVRAWRRELEQLREQFAAPIAAIHAALDHEREG